MKKIISILIASFLLIPLAVHADRDLEGELLLYSEQTTVGSTVVFRATSSCDNKTCDGMLAFNDDVLEYKSISYNYPLVDVGPDNGSVKIISNDNGVLKYDFNDPDIKDNNYTRTSIIVTFTVKSAPKNGEIDIIYTPLDGTKPIDSLRVNKVIPVKEQDKTCNCPKCDNDIQNQPVDDQNNTNECNCPIETIEEKECKNDNTWFVIGIISLIFNALLLIVILVLSKKKRNNDLVNEEIKIEKASNIDDNDSTNN